MPFEDELKRALARQEPAADFTERMLARCAAHEKRDAWWRVAAVAATLLVAAGAGIYEQHEQRGMAAKQQLLTALRIAGQKLHGAQEQVWKADEVTQ